MHLITMTSQSAQPMMRAVLRKQPAEPLPATQLPDRPPTESVQASVPEASTAEPYCLLDAASWTLQPAAVAPQLSGSSADFSVVGVLGAQGLGKSALLNQLLGFAADASGPSPSPAFPVLRPVGPALPPLRHTTRGVELHVSPDRIVGLDSQPLFSASVLEDMASGAWEQQPPAALAAAAVAAASDAKAAAVPFEGVQALAELQLCVFLLSTCHRLLVFCDGLEDRRTWELVLAAEMLARGVPDPSLPPPLTAPAAAAASPAAGGAVQQRPGGAAPGAQQAQQAAVAAGRARQGSPAMPAAAEHLAEVVLVHVLPASAASCAAGGAPTAAQLQALESRLAAFFAASRLCRPRPLRMLAAGGASSCGTGAAASEGVSYWVLPATHAGLDPAANEAWAELVAALLSRPCPPLVQRCSELAWLRGAAEAWRAVRRSPDIAAFYSRLARTQLKGAGGWGLAR